MDDERFARGRERFLEVHDEKALRAVEGLGDLGRCIVGSPPAMNAMSTLKTILAERDA